MKPKDNGRGPSGGWVGLAGVLLAVGLGLGLAPRAAAAGPYYVARSGNGSDGLTWATAFTNVQTALDAAQSNDTIYLKGETFYVPQDSATLSQYRWTSSFVTILGGYAGDGMTLTNTPTVLANTNRATGVAMTNRVFVISGVTNGTLARVTVRGGVIGNTAPQNTPYDSFYGGGIYAIACSNLVFSTVLFDGNGVYGKRQGNTQGGGLYATNCWGVLTNCTIRRSFLNTHYQTPACGAGLYLVDGGWIVRDTVVRDNAINYGGQVSATARGMGVYVASGTHLFKNCAVSRNVTYTLVPQGDAVYVANGTVSLEHCTVYWHRTEGIRRVAGTVTLKDSIVWDNGDDIAGTGVSLQYSNIEDGDSNGVAGCFSAAPRFERGLYLATNSPCVNTGSQTAASAGLDGRTTRDDGTADTGQVDLGYHFAGSCTDYYVSVTSGSDTNAGTAPGAGNALKTIGKALAMAGDGTRIYVEAGTYATNTEVFPLTTTGKWGLQLLGTNSAATVLSAKGASARVLGLNYCYPGARIEGLTLANASWTAPDTGDSSGVLGGKGGGIYLEHVGGVVSSCAVTNNAMTGGGWGAPAGGGLFMDICDALVSNCTFIGNSCTPWYPESSAGGGLYANGPLTLMGCAIVSNTTSVGGSFYGSGQHAYGGGIYLGANATVRNCLILGNDARSTATTGKTPHGDGAYVSGGTVLFENCTVVTNHPTPHARSADAYTGGLGIERGGGTVAMTNCILWANGDDVVGTVSLAYSCIEDGDNAGVAGCISNYPALASGYRLALGSPCINAGTNQSWMTGARDLDGTNRVRNVFVDMGAYEAYIPLAITNLAASGVSAGYASLNGRLLSDGEAPPAVVELYWGPTDQGMTKAGWANTNAFGVWPEQTGLSTNVALTPPSGAYSYRYYVSNAVGGEAWGDPAASFTILDVRLQASDASANELGPDAGVFTVTRSVTTVDPLTVNFAVSGTATEGTDYAPVGTSVVIPGNQSNATVTVTPGPDRLRGEGGETVSLTLLSGAYIINPQSNDTVTIGDWAPPAYACVAAGGDASYGTNWASAYTSVQFAVDTATNGDTVYLAAGTHSLTGTLAIARSQLTLRGGYSTNGSVPGAWSADTPTVLTRTGGVMRIVSISGASDVTLDRLTLADGYLSGGSVYGAGLYASGASNLTLSSLRVLGNVLVGPGYCNNFGAGLYLENTWGTITNSLIRDNVAGRNVSMQIRGIGAYVSGGGWLIQDTVVRDNRAGYFFNLYGSNDGTVQGAGLHMAAGGHVLRNSLVIGNLCPTPYRSFGSTLGEGLYVAAGTTVVHSATVGFHLLEGVRRAGGVLAITNSILYGSPTDCVGVPTNTVGFCNIGAADRVFAGLNSNLATNPAFEYGYYLAAGSPCIDAGSGVVGDQGLGGSIVRADGTVDTGSVDLGYHAAAGMPVDRMDLYVSVNAMGASDANAGTSWALPLKSITRALQLAQDGTRIHVGPGAYTNGLETFPLAMTNRLSLQIVGAGMTSTVINAAGAGARAVRMIRTYPDALLQGVGMINANWSAPGLGWGTPGTLGVALYLGSVKGAVVSCMATNNTAPRHGGGDGSPGYPAGTIHAEDSDTVISNCMVMYNSSVSAYAEGFMAAGISVAGQSATLANCVIASNRNTGADLATWGFGFGSGLYLNGAGTVRNCLIYGNSGAALTHPANRINGQGAYVAAGAWILENITMATNWNRGLPSSSEGLYVAGGTLAVTNSILWGNGTDATGTLTAAYSDIGVAGSAVLLSSCISTDPQFVFPATNNYRLADTSPCINRGISLPWMAGATDLDGNRRIMSTRVDMGAYEALPPPGTVFTTR